MVLVCIFLMPNDALHLFMCQLAIYVSSLENVYSNPGPFLNWVICLFIVEVEGGVFIYSGCKFLIKIYDLPNFCQFCGLSFHFLGNSILRTKRFKFLWNPTCLFFLLLLVLLVLYLRNYRSSLSLWRLAHVFLERFNNFCSYV